MSVSVIRTRDYPAIREVVTDPSVYPHLTEDFSPSPEEFQLPESDAIFYIAAQDSWRTIGLCMFMPINGTTVDVHIAALPDHRGFAALQLARLSFQWIWENTQYQRIEARIPDYNKPAIRLASLSGMKRMGVSEKSFLKGGLLHDQVLLGISKGES